MLNFPSSAQVNKRIPKQRFYENMTISQTTKRVFVEQIKNITWLNKIAPSTINVENGSNVVEIEIIQIVLSQKEFDTSVLKQIDNAIPYHNIYLLSFNDEIQAWIRFQADDGSLTKYYNTEWIAQDNFSLQIKGLNIDAVYEGFVEQISGICKSKDETLTEQLVKEEKARKLADEIGKLEKQARNEKQPRKKYNIVQTIKKLQAELEAL